MMITFVSYGKYQLTYLTLLCQGEENIYLDDFDVKLRKKLLCMLFF
jgi:hypothetical protein